MANNAGRTSDPGIYTGAPLPPPSIDAFSNPAPTASILASSVVGCLFASFGSALTPAQLAQSGVSRGIQKDLSKLLPSDQLADVMNPQHGAFPDIANIAKAQLNNLFTSPAPAGAGYEARVLHGIWATAPYLHKGSVPNLWELLKPAKDRISTFMVGSRQFDPKNVSFVVDQTPYKDGTFVADPNNANGNGNGGHEYGTNLTEEECWAIIEYLKQF